MRVSRRFWIAVLLCPWLSTAALAQPPRAGAAAASPAPAPFFDARAIFVSNAGLDAHSLDILLQAGKADVPYASFLAAMRSWGYYNLVTAPFDSTAVFEFRILSAPASVPFGSPSYHSFMMLAVIDTRTHITVWSLSTPVDLSLPALEQHTHDSAAQLVAALKKLPVPTRAMLDHSP